MAKPKWKCGDCGRCPCLKCHPEPCERIDRGRRIFLIGALAAPVARKVTLAAAPKIVAPPPLVLPAGLTWETLIYGVAISGFVAAAYGFRHLQGGEINVTVAPSGAAP